MSGWSGSVGVSVEVRWPAQNTRSRVRAEPRVQHGARHQTIQPTVRKLQEEELAQIPFPEEQAEVFDALKVGGQMWR